MLETLNKIHYYLIAPISFLIWLPENLKLMWFALYSSWTELVYTIKKEMHRLNIKERVGIPFFFDGAQL